MTVPVTYYCPHCETVLALEREGYLADKAVTPYPFEGWEYASPTDPFEDADGVRFVCGASEGVEWDPEPTHPDTSDGADVATENGVAATAGGVGCGEPFYLSFVRFDEGREIEPRAETELVEIDPDPRSSGPRGPGGPGGGVW